MAFQQIRRRNDLLRLAAVFALFFATSEGQAKSTYNVIYNFGEDDFFDGSYSEADLTYDTAGNLYGTTYSGGPDGDGTVFKIAPDGTETILHNFTFQGGDGSFPSGGVTVVRSTGDLYGTTSAGGAGHGTIWRIKASGEISILHSFITEEGGTPTGRMSRDKLGNFYGVAQLGGQGGDGTVWKFAPDGTFKVLYAFTGGTDGGFPSASLIRDKAGNLYGVAARGGSDGHGVVFKIKSNGMEKVLYNFSGAADGSGPEGAMVRDKAGNLYGTAKYGGANGRGTVWRLAANGGFTVLHAFAGGSDGSKPTGNLLRIGESLYGTTAEGGGAGCPTPGCGTVYKLALDGTEKILHGFAGSPSDGENLLAGLTKGRNGLLFGITAMGGPGNGGVVFSVKQ